MPVKIKDSEGNDVEVFTQADVDVVVSAKLEEQKSQFETTLNTKFEEFNKDKEPKEPQAPKPKEDGDEPPAWFKPFADQFQQISSNHERQYIDGVIKTLDADRQKEVRDRYANLQGYENTPEGLEKRAKDAYLLVVGEQPDSGAVDMQNISAAGGGRSDTSVKTFTEQDKQVQAVLGLTEDDVKKYGGKQS